VILALEHADLLTQRHDFQSETISEAQEGTQPPKEAYDEFEHEGNLHGPLVISKVPPKPLISQGDRFLATHTWGRGVAPGDALKVYVVLGTVLLPMTALFSSHYLFAESRKFPQDSPLLGLVYGLSIPLFDLGGVLEELGWRGFALPHLEKRMPSPLAATIFLGELWAAWHLPSWTPTFLTSREPPQEWIGQMSAFFLGTIALAILMTYLFHRTGGSILPAVILHGTANLWTRSDLPRFWGGAPVLHYLGFSQLLIICAAVIAIVKTGSQLGRLNSC
jgi:membrane protease YdiL (CAAX protease family)